MQLPSMTGLMYNAALLLALGVLYDLLGARTRDARFDPKRLLTGFLGGCWRITRFVAERRTSFGRARRAIADWASIWKSWYGCARRSWIGA